MAELFLILHGVGGNKPTHWQEFLARELLGAGQDVRYPKMPAPDQPDLGTWMETLHRELGALASDSSLTVLAHSRGCLLWLHHAAMSTDSPIGAQAQRVLLVAPPYQLPELAEPGWFPVPLSPDGIKATGQETAIVASDDDEFATFDEASSYADALGIPIYLLSGAGHISPYYGYGDWPWVRDWCLHQADLPPQPLPT